METRQQTRSAAAAWVLLVALAALTALAAGGCGGAAKAELAAATEGVQAGLDLWKGGQTPAGLGGRTPPVEFHDDDWRQGARLVDYRVVKAYRSDDGTSRCAVVLSLAARNGRKWEREVVYQVKPGASLVVARDPYS